MFSGFYSKDSVLAAALGNAQQHGGAAWGPLVLAAAGSLLTAAYMLRWWLRLFTGEERDHEVAHHAHDPAGGAKWVLLALAPFTLVIPWTVGDWLNVALGMKILRQASTRAPRARDARWISFRISCYPRVGPFLKGV